jgi:deoxyribodipyrimidine photo-lyase
MKVNIVWFRRDLRLLDNEIVALACENNCPTIFVFCVDPWFYNQKEIGWKRVHFLFESLVDLDQELQKLGSRLIILEGNTIENLQSLALTLNSKGFEPQLFFNTDIQVDYGLERDKTIRELWLNNNWSIHEGLGSFLIITKDNVDFKSWGKKYYDYQLTKIWLKPTQINSFDISTLQLSVIVSEPKDLQIRFNSKKQPKSNLFNGGESEAHKVLNSFVNERSVGYHWKLSRPWQSQIGGVSQLSPHIAFGTISTRVVYQSSRSKRKLTNPKHAFALKAFEERLRWRDHFLNKLLRDPSIKWKNHYYEYDQVYTTDPLSTEKQDYFDNWKKGETGFALIDASMRQLNSQGFMNFRMRAMNATFLTINCGVSWHFGAEYFMNQLVDGDIAINHWQWQMQAGITNPFSNTFRIYNPTTNIKEKDPKIEYIHFWCPEHGSCLTVDEVIDSSKPMLDFAETRKENAKIISDLRHKVRERLSKEYGVVLPNKKVRKTKEVMVNDAEDLFGEGNA